MKPLKSSVLFLSILIAALSSKAFEIGGLQIAGTGCEAPTGGQELIPILDKPMAFGIPLNMTQEKSADATLLRKSCTMSLPITLAAGEKLQVLDVSQKVRLRAGAKSKASTQLEVFLAGQEGQILKAEIEGKNKTVRSSQTLNDDGVVAESECGKDVIVRANSIAMIQGTAKARVETDALILSLRVVSCR